MAKTVDLRTKKAFYIEGYVVDEAVLAAILNPDNRILWRFTKQGDNITAVPFSESRVIWLETPPEVP